MKMFNVLLLCPEEERRWRENPEREAASFPRVLPLTVLFLDELLLDLDADVLFEAGWQTRRWIDVDARDVPWAQINSPRGVYTLSNPIMHAGIKFRV